MKTEDFIWKTPASYGRSSSRNAEIATFGEIRKQLFEIFLLSAIS